MWNNIKLAVGLTLHLSPVIATLIGGSYLVYLYLEALSVSLDFWVQTANTF